MKVGFTCTIVIFALLMCSHANADNGPTKAITEDGDTVLLKPDGTWEALEKEKSGRTCTEENALTVEYEDFVINRNKFRGTCVAIPDAKAIVSGINGVYLYTGMTVTSKVYVKVSAIPGEDKKRLLSRREHYKFTVIGTPKDHYTDTEIDIMASEWIWDTD